MTVLRRAALSAGLLVGFATAPVADARVSVERTVKGPTHAKLRMTRLGGVPSSVVAGGAFRVRGRVVNLPRRMTKPGRLTFTLRKRANSRLTVKLLRRAKLYRTRASTSRRFRLRIRVPARVAAGRWVFRACVRRGSGRRNTSCRSKRIRVTAHPGPGGGGDTGGGGGTGGGGPGGGGGGTPGPEDGRHSLRSAVTDQNFYFVMADRFRNGDPTNDNGGLPQGTDNGHSEGESGFDPTGKGWYHGGDLAGLRSRLGYIDDLGTTAIWLTPSFKNKAVQDNNGFPSAGYHGYWVTDFTQIDPHFGTNSELTGLIRDAHARGIKVFFDIISNHTADVIRYSEGDRMPYTSKDT